MAIDLSRYTAKSETLISRLIPLFLRGNKMFKFLSAICSPIDKANENFQSWAKDMLIDAATTSQIIVLKWSLKAKLSKYFENEEDVFYINTYGRTNYTTVYENQTEQNLHPEADNIYMPEDTTDTSVAEDVQVVIRDKEEISSESNDLTVVAPVHNSSITDEQYIQKIKQCIEPYLAYDMEYQVVINGTNE